MDFKQLSYLIDIAKTSSINTTAKRLFISQSTISESIKRLEWELNAKLLHRSHTGVDLSADGKFLLSQALPIMEHYQQVLNYFNQKKTAPHDVLSIGAAGLITKTVLPDLIFQIQQDYPDVVMFTREMMVDEIFDALLQDKLTFGLFGFSDALVLEITDFKTARFPSLQFRPLYSDSFVCVMHKNNALASNSQYTYNEVSKLKHTILDYAYYSKNAHQLCLHISTNVEIHKKFMREKSTVLIIPKHSAKRLFQEKEFVHIPICDLPSTTFYLVYSKSKEFLNNDVHQAFIQSIISLTKHIHQ